MGRFCKGFLIISVFSLIILSAFNSYLPEFPAQPISLNTQLNFLTDSPISISGDAQLNATASAGNGTAINPYILENYIINASGSGLDAILIQNTNAHFILRNCTIIATDVFQAGIKLVNVKNGTFLDNRLDFSNWGPYAIVIDSSEDIYLRNNTMNKGYYGIHVESASKNITITQNSIQQTMFYGIRTISLNNSQIFNNYFGYNRYTGIWLASSHHNTLQNNTFEYNEIAIYLGGSRFNHIVNNTVLYGDPQGIVISGSHNNTFLENTVKFCNSWGIKLGSGALGNNLTGNIVTDCEIGINIEEAYDTLLMDNKLSNNTDTGLKLKNTPSGQRIYSNQFIKTGILITGSVISMYEHTISQDNTVNGYPIRYHKYQDNFVVSGSLGQVILVACTKAQVVLCNLIEGSGISLVSTNHSRVSSNTIIGADYYGIHLLKSFNNTVCNNKINASRGYGIYLEQSENNTLCSNSANINGFSFIEYFGTGIYLLNSDNNTITQNDAHGNEYFGIRLSSSHNNSVINNNIIGNGYSGLYLTSSNYTIIIHNYFTENMVGISLSSSNHNLIKWNQLIGDGIEAFNCFGNIIEENDYNGGNNGGDPPLDYRWLIILGICLICVITFVLVYRSRRSHMTPQPTSTSITVSSEALEAPIQVITSTGISPRIFPSAELFIAIEETGLADTIPSGDEILYSTMCEAVYRGSRYTGTGMTQYKSVWQTPVVITKRGIAYMEKVVDRPGDLNVYEIPGTAAFMPWYGVRWIARGRFLISKTQFKLIRTPALETEEQFDVRFHELGGKFRPLMKQIKRDAGMANKGLKILLGSLGIGAILFFIGFFGFGYPLESLLSSYYWGSDFLIMSMFSLGLGFFISWIIVSRLTVRAIKKYEAAVGI